MVQPNARDVLPSCIGTRNYKRVFLTHSRLERKRVSCQYVNKRRNTTVYVSGIRWFTHSNNGCGKDYLRYIHRGCVHSSLWKITQLSLS
jgi:hypothetical protein